ncbi:unnamed protein product, partial [marine sediment metagenome]
GNPLEVHDPKVGSLISYEGVTTADGAGGGLTLIDSVLATKPDYDGNQVIITSGAYAGQVRDISGATNNVTGTVTPSSAFGGQILSGTNFVIAALRLIPAEIAAIEAKLDHATHGLAALKALIDAVEGKLDGASGLAALKAVVDAILVDTGTTLPATLTAIVNYLDSEIADILADTTEIQTSLAEGGFIDLLIDAIKAETALIKAATDKIGGKMLFTMDFWSDPVEVKVVTAAQVTAAVGAAVTIADLPVDAAIVRAIVMMKFRMVENTNGAENSLD